MAHPAAHFAASMRNIYTTRRSRRTLRPLPATYIGNSPQSVYTSRRHPHYWEAAWTNRETSPRFRSSPSAADKHVRVTGHTAILLADGRVLVTGDLLHSPDAVDTDGYPLGTLVPIADLYDPDTNSWSFTGQMTRRRSWPQATLLEDGTVLVVGSSSRSTPRPTADIYYPAINTWSPTNRFFRDRFDHSETILGDGSVLIAGGMSGDPQAPTLVTTAPVYDPSARYLALVDGPAKARHDHGAILPFDGTVLVGVDEFSKVE